jgi:hypothetical protein
MAVSKKYPTQVVLVSTQEMKDHIVKRSERDEVSQADKTREYVEGGMALEGHSERTGYSVEQLLSVLDKVQPIGTDG